MNKKILSPLLLAMLATSAYAVDAPTPASSTDTTNSIVAVPPAPNSATPQPTDATPVAAPAIDCNLHIPSNQTTVDATLITTWASKAALQSFNFSPATIDNQLEALKACYTEAGWKGFSDALQKSGNIESIKSQQLTVSSQEDGQATINAVKDNQWKIVLPIQAVYQNDKEKVIQRLNIEVLVGRKASGDLGIMQMIATTRPAETPAPAVTEPSEDQAPTSESTPAQPAGNPGAAPTAPATPATNPQVAP